jgi:hypothetical protein
MPANQMAEQYLQTFSAHGDFPGGLAFRKALDQARLDFTPDSLQRIDLLLRQMRTQLRPVYAEFIDRQENQNFLYLLCFYVGAVVYRYTGENFAWYAYDELKQVAPPDFLAEYPECFGSSMICMLEDSGTFLPLSAILDLLFDEDPARSVVASAATFMGRLADASPIARPQPGITLRDDRITQALRAAGNCAGWAASYATWMICEGGPLDKIIQQQLRDGRRAGITLMDSSLQEAFERLQRNDEGAAVSALTYQGVVGLPAARSRAVVLEVRTLAMPELELTIALPFRAAGPAGGFALSSPHLLRPTGLSAMAHQVIGAGFFEGADAYRPAGLLDKYLQAAA